MPEDFQDRYEIISRIGSGGVGAVYQAKDTRLGRMVAVKRLLPPEESEDQARLGSDLIKEARALSAFQHPNIVTVFDYGEDEDGLYIIMELLAGETLEELARRAPLHVDTFTQLAEQCLEGLADAHGRDLLHRDLKPSNLFVTPVNGDQIQVKLLDFGLAKFSAQPALQTVDQSRSILGSIYFMAPEQFLREPLDDRCDLYQLGCVLFYALTSQYAFDGGTTAAVMNAHLDHTPKDLKALRPDVPEDLRNWVFSLIAREPGQRPASAAIALQQLRIVARDNGLTAAQPLLVGPTAPVRVQRNTGGVPLTPTAGVQHSATEAYLRKQRSPQARKTAVIKASARQHSTPVWTAGITVLALFFAGVVIYAFSDPGGRTEKGAASVIPVLAPPLSGAEVDLNARYAVYALDGSGYSLAQPGDRVSVWNDLAPIGGTSIASVAPASGSDPQYYFPTYVTETLTSTGSDRPGLRFDGDQLLVLSGEGGGADLSGEARHGGAVSLFVLVRPEDDLEGYASILNAFRSAAPVDDGSQLERASYYSVYSDDREVGFLLSQSGTVLRENAVSVQRDRNAPVLCEVRVGGDRKTVTVTTWNREGRPVGSAVNAFAMPIFFSNQFHVGRLRGPSRDINEVPGRLHNFRGTLFGLRIASGEGVSDAVRGEIAREMWAGIVPGVALPPAPQGGG